MAEGKNKIKIFIIAGESSGDNIGGKIMAALKKLSAKPIEFQGIGGEKMAEQGLKSRFPISELSLMGFAEILPHIPKLLKRIGQTAEQIKDFKPDLVITIDSPGFNFRIAKKLVGSGIKKLHIVAPSVWAYKPERAAKTAKLFERLLVILPFETPYFEKEGLATEYIGHTIIEDMEVIGDAKDFREKNWIPPGSPLLLIMPGSRKGELKRLLPVFKETAAIVKEKIKDLRVAFLATPRFKEDLEDFAKGMPAETIVISEEAEKPGLKAAADFALIKSGTSSLEIAMAKIPMVVAYKVNAVSAWLIRRMIRVKYVSLINIILGKEAIPEFIQENCKARPIAAKLVEIYTNQESRELQLKNIESALQQLGLGEKSLPSEKAAASILKEIG